ncbi:OST1 [[Candida] subhashii]|uniref:Dolichyl-diphosphooligosaccharide--protein glycosyltransferase subunit 1 n=1 Tax=[Candida] subhashii TaxID=561895 RepID=A0A8J5QND3_9ASCO|nr:OST1 [[Candida] subhashii]KAG7666207.1 OST1 [[Candida] subhashii]
MWNQLIIALGFVLTLCQSQLIDSISTNNSWENTDYTRVIDLSRSYVRETDHIQIKNTNSVPQDEYYFVVNDGFGSVGELSIFAAVLPEQGNLEIEYDEIIPNQVFKLKLPVPIAPNSNIEIKINYFYINALVAQPAKISLDEVQRVLYTTNKFPFSPYVTKQYAAHYSGMSKGEEIDLKLGLTNTDLDITPAVSNKVLIYGPFTKDIPPFTISPMGLRYDFNYPLAKAVNYKRSIWLPASDVNKVSIEEYFELTHAGAELSPGFSRVDWMKGRYEAKREHWALGFLDFPLDGQDQLEDFYYTDKVGVVSTSTFVKGHLLLRPRFPLFGGWFYNFTLGWSDDLSKYLHKLTGTNDEYIIKFPLVSSIKDFTYENVFVEFYLPENAEFVNVSSPIRYESLTIENELSYLDVSKGHVKVVVHFKNLFDDLVKLDLFVRYKYSQADFIYKVGKIAGFIFLALISYYLLGMVDLSIQKKQDTEKKPIEKESKSVEKEKKSSSEKEKKSGEVEKKSE